MTVPSWVWRGVAVIVVLGSTVPERAFAQWRAEMLPGLRFGPPLKAGAAFGVAYGKRMRAGMSIAVRTAGDPLRYANAVREAIWSVDRDQTITKVETL